MTDETMVAMVIGKFKPEELQKFQKEGHRVIWMPSGYVELTRPLVKEDGKWTVDTENLL